jgi:ATP-dependent exoDNAse (exonuclease V) beta subunit
LRELVRDFGFGAEEPFGLVRAVTKVARAIREEGVSPRWVPVQDASEAKEAFLATIRGLRLIATSTQRGLGIKDSYRARVDEVCRRLALVTTETWLEHRDALDEAAKGWRRDDVRPLRDALRGGPDGEGSPGALFAAYRMAPFDAAVRSLVEEAIGSYEAALDERGALDFTALLVRARDLLRSSPEARRDVHCRFQAVLVDEFQDTNRVQLELVLLLTERREGSPRPLSFEIGGGPSNEVLEFPLEPAALAVVGDRKQAIYDFRGADVAVFELMAQCIERHGGQRQFLKHSRRATAPVVELCNNQSALVLRRENDERGALPFEVEFDPATDALAAVRTDRPSGPALVRLVAPELQGQANAMSAEAWRVAEADALARYLASKLKDPHSTVMAKTAGALQERMIRGSDIAVLFQRFTQLEVYRLALVRHGVRHRIVRGRGFFAAQEVIDLASLLFLVGDPTHVIACAAVLRSPLVGLSDASLVSLALDGESTVGLRPRALLFGSDVDLHALSDEERRRLSRFIDVFRVMFDERARLGIRGLVTMALDQLHYRVAVAAGPFGEQGLANIDKLLEMAAQRDAAGALAPQFANELLELSEAEPNEAQGEVLDEGDLEAVTLMTVHQAKGLEWPVVVLPELFAAAPAGGERVRFDRDVGLAVASLSGEPASSVRWLQCKSLRAKRETAQRRRLLYVALTRARDRVVLGLQPERAPKPTWAGWLQFRDFWWNHFHEAGLAVEVDVASLPPGRADPPATSTAEAVTREVKALVAKARARPSLKVRDIVLPVTQVQDFLLCPRRYRLAHGVGLEEDAPSVEWDDETASFGIADARTLGVAVHRLLELAPLEWIGSASVGDRLLSLQKRRGVPTEQDETVAQWAAQFFMSDFARALLGARRVLREMPFVIRIEDESLRLHLRGQIDLLVVTDRVDVIDYKTTSKSFVDPPFLVQLACYRLAARRFFASEQLPIRAGAVFVRETNPAPSFFESLPDGPSLERQLLDAARALVAAQTTERWVGQPLERCQALGCGYRERCHGHGAGSSSLPVR